MIEFLSSWAKSLGLAIVIISILEMLLPNNKTKKYIRMVMGIYILFSIVSPLINNKEIFNLNELSLENIQTSSTTTVNQTSMNDRIEQLYTQELEKDITKKVEQKGYEVNTCIVEAKIGNQEEETQITKIVLQISKKEQQEDNQTEEKNDKSNGIGINLENTIVTEIQKIKEIEISNNSNKHKQKNNETESQFDENSQQNNKTNTSKSDIQNIKKFLIEEYGVNEKCLEIN